MAGFEDSRALARKMVKLFKLASEQLSQQDHYDFGMRAIKSALVRAGSLRRSEAHLAEDVVLIRAMRDSNLPKLLAADIELFQNIISDLFPGVDVPVQVWAAAAVPAKLETVCMCGKHFCCSPSVWYRKPCQGSGSASWLVSGFSKCGMQHAHLPAQASIQYKACGCSFVVLTGKHCCTHM